MNMSAHKNKANQCIPVSELTPKQLEALPISPGNLDSFDEKLKLPPTARAQWAYVQLNPNDFLERFTNELGLLGINIAVCFVNKEPYEDTVKDLRTPITVNLIVHADHYSKIKEHLVEKRLSFKELEDNKGFALPFLGSIQKQIDTLALESLMNYVFIKNSISREAYYIWISIPKSYLETKKPAESKAKESAKQVDSTGDKKPTPVPQVGDTSEAKPKAQVPSQARKPKDAKENFNYVIYDDTGETAPPMVPIPEEPKQQSVIVAAEPVRQKQSFLSKLKSAKKGKEKNPSSNPKEKKVSPCPSAKFDSALFLGIGLFNFFTSILLITFLSTLLEEIVAIRMEILSAAAVISMIFAMLVIRPSFKFKAARLWTLSAYVLFGALTAFFVHNNTAFPETPDYLIPTAYSLGSFVLALVAAIMRVDRATSSKAKKSKADAKSEKKGQDIPEDTQQETKVTAPPAVPAKAAKRHLPPPIKKKAKQDTTKKVVMKRSPKKETPTTAEPKPEATETPVVEKRTPIVRKSIPTNPISEEQKDVIRNRLARRDRLTTPLAAGQNTPQSAQEANIDSKQLSTEEIKAKLASRLQRSKALKNGIDNKDAEPVPQKPANQDGEERKTIRLRKPSEEEAKKLTAPKGS